VFDNAYLSEPGHYSRSIVVEALDDVYSFSEVGYYLLNIFFLCLEEKMLLVSYVFYNIFETAYYDFKVSLLFPLLEESLTCSITFL
jgi:hypothetical protein